MGKGQSAEKAYEQGQKKREHMNKGRKRENIWTRTEKEKTYAQGQKKGKVNQLNAK